MVIGESRSAIQKFQQRSSPIMTHDMSPKTAMGTATAMVTSAICQVRCTASSPTAVPIINAPMTTEARPMWATPEVALQPPLAPAVHAGNQTSAARPIPIIAVAAGRRH